ncbi:MAG: hypothetical protein JXA81_06225 [Sedimentisphaerales bacterium]|nr:hypothetical protein [Sedimentisphaerales bacterium]
MDQDELKKIIEGPDEYDRAKEDGLLGMVGDFYTRKMLSMVVLVWGMGIIFMGIAIFSAIRFFGTGEIRYQIMYAIIFLTCVQWVSSLKVFAWQLIHRNSIKREIKRLELRIAELNEALRTNK